MRPPRNVLRYPILEAITPATGPNTRPTNAYGVSVASETVSALMLAPTEVSCASAGTMPFMTANTPVMVSKVVSNRPQVRRSLRYVS